MISKLLEWTATIALPPVDKPHEAIHAFLRTSEFGEWQPNPEKESDAFVLNYRRGRPYRKSGFFGIGASLDWNTPTYPESVPVEQARMFLRVTLRPSPTVLTIRVQHTAPVMDHRRMSAGTTEVCERFERQLEKAVHGESTALRTYLHDYYRLTEPPSLDLE
ncbi:MAG: hypothetical protein RIC55_08040 [Pirellulaceae bacterium]